MSSPLDPRTAPPPDRLRATRRLRALIVIVLLLAAAAGGYRLSSHLNERSLETASLAELQKLTTQQPNDERTLFYLARRQEQAGQTPEAMETYNRALQLDQDDAAAWLGFARTTQRAAGGAQARKVVETWLVRDPRSAAAYGMLARLAQQNGETLEAYNAAARATALDPHDGDLWQLMGAQAAALERSADAEAAFRHAIACKPTDWRNQAGRGSALALLGRHAEALACFRDTVRLAPELGVTHLLLGTELLDAAVGDADIEAARAELLQSAQKESELPRSAQVQTASLLGDSYRRQRRWQEALGWYRRAEQGDPLNPTVQYSLITVCESLGDKAAAARAEARHRDIEAYDHALKVLVDHLQAVPDDAAARLRLARLYRSHGAFEAAARAYTALLARSPDQPIARQELQSLLASRPPASP